MNISVGREITHISRLHTCIEMVMMCRVTSFRAKLAGHDVDTDHGVFVLRVYYLDWDKSFNTDEPVYYMFETAPHMVKDYLYPNVDDEVCQRAIFAKSKQPTTS